MQIREHLSWVRRPVICGSVIVMLLVIYSALLFYAYKTIRKDIESVKTELASRSGFIPPLYGARHIEVRQFMVLAQAEQQNSEFALIVGDSVTEGLFLQRVAGFPLINGGLGGGGVFFFF